ncbi:MAG: 4'-phosphopantetheinyl transferase superfamily protein [Candidatus Ratteibacteria bacterium]
MRNILRGQKGKISGFLGHRPYKIAGIGTDIAEFSRIAMVLRRNEKRFLERIYTEREYSSFPPSRIVRYCTLNFSFKESVWKALAPSLQKHTRLKDIEIIWKKRRPELFLYGKPLIAEYGWYCAKTFCVTTIILPFTSS